MRTVVIADGWRLLFVPRARLHVLRKKCFSQRRVS